MRERPSLRSKLRKAMVAPTLLAVGLSLAFTLVFGWINYRDTAERASSEVRSASLLASRRVTAELLIGPHGAPDIVAATLKADLALDDLQILHERPACLPSRAGGTCLETSWRKVTAYSRADGSNDRIYVAATRKIPSPIGSIPLNLLLLTTLPVLFFIGVAIYLQQRQLKKYFLDPIQSITDKTVAESELPRHWPKEFAQLHSELDSALKQREQAIIGQISSGVIHDLKTLLQPISGALQLADEKTSDGDKLKSSAMLFRACQRNVPKIQTIIESVLDGNREIQLRIRNASLNQTLLSALKSAGQAVNEAEQVQVETALPSEELELQHDPVQLERALTNLIKNGLEAAQTSRNSKTLRVVLEKTSAGPQFTIEDTGPGLPGSLEQLSTSRRSTKLRGTGLGLLISRKIIEAHRGQLSAGSSDALSGAKFTVTLGGNVQC